jgi:hypothetical protein
MSITWIGNIWNKISIAKDWICPSEEILKWSEEILNVGKIPQRDKPSQFPHRHESESTLRILQATRSHSPKEPAVDPSFPSPVKHSIPKKGRYVEGFALPKIENGQNV